MNLLKSVKVRKRTEVEINLSDEELYNRMKNSERNMKRAAKAMEFEEAALWRDRLAGLRQQWSDRYGSRADSALRRQESQNKRINRPLKKRI